MHEGSVAGHRRDDRARCDGERSRGRAALAESERRPDESAEQQVGLMERRREKGYVVTEERDLADDDQCRDESELLEPMLAEACPRGAPPCEDHRRHDEGAYHVANPPGTPRVADLWSADDAADGQTRHTDSRADDRARQCNEDDADSALD